MKDILKVILSFVILTGCVKDKTEPEFNFGKEIDYSDHIEVNVEWTNDNAKLSGTLYLPKDSIKYSTLVWVHGSGKTERIIYNDNNQWVRFILAKEYIDKGYAIFSYDKRGVGQSTGQFSDNMDENNYMQLGRDALSALRVIKNHPKVDGDHVGFIGASQAGWTIPIIAKTTDEIAFIIIINGPTCANGEEDLFSLMTQDDPLEARKERECCCINLDSIYAILESNRQNERTYWGYSSYNDLTLIDQPCLFIQGLQDLSQPAKLCVKDLQQIIKDYNKNWEILAFENADHYLLKGNGRCMIDNNPEDITRELNYIVDWKTPTINWLDKIINK